jgi:hypothetical protein
MLNNDDTKTRSRSRGGRATSELEYQVDPKEATSRRLAHFLLWAAERWPRRPIELQVAARIVLILSRTPTLDGKEVHRLLGVVNVARKILITEYKRGLIRVEGRGIRATADSEDLASTQFEKAAQRAASSIRTLDQNRAAIKMSDINDSKIRSRVMQVASACKTLTSADVLAKLRLPEDTTNKKEKQ